VNPPPSPLPSQPQPNPPRAEVLGDPKLLLNLSASQLHGLWLEVQAEIRSAQLEVGLLTARVHRDKLLAWNKSMEQSVSGRDRDASLYVLDMENGLTEAKTQLLALESERAMYEFVLDRKVWA
jgi:hypothetical protein